MRLAVFDFTINISMSGIHLVVTFPQRITRSFFVDQAKEPHSGQIEILHVPIIIKCDMPRDFFINEILIPHFHPDDLPARPLKGLAADFMGSPLPCVDKLTPTESVAAA